MSSVSNQITPFLVWTILNQLEAIDLFPMSSTSDKMYCTLVSTAIKRSELHLRQGKAQNASKNWVIYL